MVLLHQRARAALFEPPLSARLQYCAAPLVLALPPALALSVECLFCGRSQARFPFARSRVAHPPAGAVLDGLHPGVLHFLNNAGILFDAVLSGAGAAGGIRPDRPRIGEAV